MNSIGARIKAKRLENKLSQRDLAIKAGWGDNQTRISSYESDRTEPNYSDMAKIASVLGTNAAWLAFGGEEEGVAKVKHDYSDSISIPMIEDYDFVKTKKSGYSQSIKLNLGDIESQGLSVNSIFCLKISDNSMSPVLPAGAVVGVDTSHLNVIDGDMYLIKQGSIVRVRLLYRTAAGYRIKSYNETEWPVETVEGESADAIEVIGRIFSYSVVR